MANTFEKITVHAAGTTFQNRQGKLWNLRKHEKGAWIELRREKHNEYDDNAIAIIAHTKTTRPAKIGYIPANVAASLAKRMDSGLMVKVFKPTSGKFVTGNKTLGCVLTIVYQLAPNEVPMAMSAMAIEEQN